MSGPWTATAWDARPGGVEKAASGARRQSKSGAGTEVGLLTGGGDKPYAIGLARALCECGVGLDFIGSDELDVAELREQERLHFLNLRGDQSADAGPLRKAMRVLAYYTRLSRYGASGRPRLLHLLWNNKFEYFDRTVMMAWYRTWGRRVVMTVHNVNAGARDRSDSRLNRWTLGAQYRMAAHLFVHTRAMKEALRDQFGIPGDRVTVIPFGVNDTVPRTTITSAEARHRLGCAKEDKVILFFGNVARYKGLDVLLRALAESRCAPRWRLLVAGRLKCDPEHECELRRWLEDERIRGRVIARFEFVPDEETELYFKAADVLVLPYRFIFQSGVLFLSYSFGLPVIAADVGALREDVVEGETGFICRPEDPGSLAATLERYFASPLFADLPERRAAIRRHALERYSWAEVARRTLEVYQRVAA